jgi:dihydrofolate reductase
MSIIAIIAIAKNYAIGKDGKLPWHYPADLKFFKETTTGHAVVMGSHTWKSIGRPLPNRLNIVLSRSAEVGETPNVRLLRSKDEVLKLAKTLDTDIFIIGGAKTYETFADSIDKWIVTEVPETVEDADTFMPENFLNGFALKDTKGLDGTLKVKIYERMQGV